MEERVVVFCIFVFSIAVSYSGSDAIIVTPGIKWCEHLQDSFDVGGNNGSDQVNVTPPMVNLTVRNAPTNERKTLFVNETYTVLTNEDANVAFFCAATYPVQWVEIYGEVLTFT